MSIGGGSITNNQGAEITGQETTGSGRKGHGVLVDNSSGGNAFSATTVTNDGLIRGYDSYAIRFIGSFADTVTNNANGIIRGGGNAAEGAAIQTGDGADTLTNRGSIVGDNGLAIDLEAGNDILHLIGGTVSGDISGGGSSNTLDFDGNFSYAGSLSNFASVEVKSGAVTLAGASSYAGNTTVSAGSLYANNLANSATGSGTVIVKSGATLGGSGRVAAVIAETGSSIAPGNAAAPGNLATLSINGNLAITSGTRFSFEVGSSADRVNVGGTLAFSGGGAAVIDIVDAGIVAGNDYTLINFAAASGPTTASFVLGSIPPELEASLDLTPTALILRTAAAIDVSTTSLSFAERLVETASDEQLVTVTNTGTVTLRVGTPTVTGAAAGDFLAGSNSCTGGIAPNASCQIGIGFRPSAAGSRSATLAIPSNAAGSPTEVSLSGTGIAAVYSLSADPASTDFGSQPVASASTARSVSLRNNGNSAITITGFSAGGNHPTEFPIGNDGCSGHLLAVDQSCTVSFRFTPAASGGRSASVTVSSSPAQSGLAARLALQGVGTEASASLNPASLSFAAQAVGSHSPAQNVVLSNTGNAALTISSIAASGDFSQTHHCGLMLAASSSCDIEVTFAPTVAGPRNGTLSVFSSAAGSPTVASLDGSGVQAGLGTSGPLSFGNQAVATTSANQSVTVTNTGAAALTVGTPSLGGENPGDYAIVGSNCSGSIAPAASCSIGISFRPSAIGSRNASLSIPSNAPGSPASVPLSGTGIAASGKVMRLALAAANVNIKEGAGSAVFVVNRSGSLEGAISVRYASADGSAVAGQDYQATSGTLSWAPGDSAPKSITVPVIDDPVAEDKESFTINLSVPTGGAILGRSTASGNIADNDKAGALAFSASAVSVAENAGLLTVTVQRIGGQSNDISVHYATVNGSALAGADYAATAGDLNWAAGDSADKTFTIPITWDNLAERDENFRVELSAPTGRARLNNPKAQRVKIVNVNH